MYQNPSSVFHVSEERHIETFAPRIDRSGEARVWAISNARLHKYLLPRNCPRVTFYARPETTPADRRTFLEDCEAVVAMERVWWTRASQTHLTIYE
ncbi:MAG: hypothetical protein O7E57_07345, partial [Gammaproteobacteria bacterium]|nr:hypothetical protein [Gammaproteobacteria bacterium]